LADSLHFSPSYCAPAFIPIFNPSFMNNKDINNTSNDCNSSNNDDHDIVTAIVRGERPIGQSDHIVCNIRCFGIS
jgi:hypothetical protein